MEGNALLETLETTLEKGKDTQLPQCPEALSAPL